MACKFAFVFFAFLAIVNAGYIAGPTFSQASYSSRAPHVIATPAAVSQHSNILCSHGNLGQVYTYGKTISTPHSRVYKSDIRISSDAFAYPDAHGYAAAPVYSHAFAAPAYSHNYAAPSYVDPSYSHGYNAPVLTFGYAAHTPTGLLSVGYSPATSAAHFSYIDGHGLHYSY